MPNPLAGLLRLLAFCRLYRWWNTSPTHKHAGRHRKGGS
jgi:hypothetical protein